MSRLTEAETRRFLERLDIPGRNECWPWKGSHDPKGYPRFRSSVSNRAYQFAYELWVGPIPEGYEIDHRCHDPEVCFLGIRCPHRSCSNPHHLAAVPPEVNRARRPTRRPDKRVEVCGRGHRRGSEHWGVRANGRDYCKTCSMLRAREQRARAAAEESTPPNGAVRLA